MRIKFLFLAFAVIAAACEKGPTEPTSPKIEFSVMSVQAGPDTATLFVSANQPVMWSLNFGLTPSYGEPMPEVGPAIDYKPTLFGLVAASHYYYQVWARNGSENVNIAGEFQTSDYPICDPRNKTAPKVKVTVVYRPTNHPANPLVYLEQPELLDCAGRLASNLNDMPISQDGGQTYVMNWWVVPVNLPGGTAKLSFRAIRSLYGTTFDGWADSAVTVNGVTLINHSSPALPAPLGCHLSPADPTANNCPPGFRLTFSVDSAGHVTP